MLSIKQRPRMYYTEAQKALIWERWQKGDSLATIARLFDRGHSSVQRIPSETGCAMTIELWMRQNTANEICLLIAEDNESARKLIRDTQRHHQDKSIVNALTERERQFFPYRKIKQDPLFEPKRRLSPIQLADYCAYVFKRHLMRDSRYDRFLNPLLSQFAIVKDASVGK